ncbi:MAG: ATP-binding protein, partial [Candidatus Parcubacteria bacterium]|nr:ATP-binding protein [Candidatus Parcubacteria bacterium]
MSEPARKENSEGLSPFAFHQGLTLLRIAEHYPYLIDVVLEAIQNALDAHATIIWVMIDHQKRKLRIEDNGDGASKSKFDRALRSICETMKDETKLGRWGMGLIAPLGKCEYFTYTSTPKENNNTYLKWRFETENIRQQKTIQGIPYEEMPLIHFDEFGKSKGGIPWRTQIKLMRFTEDRTTSKLSLASLHDSVKEKYSEAMKKLGTKIMAKIISAEGKTEEKIILADEYQGKSLPIFTRDHSDSGQTTFRLYLARQTVKGKQGKVVVGEMSNDFRLSFKKFLKTPEGFLNNRIIEALCSGIFEGEILSEKARIDSTRKFFKENDALVGLCISIEEWYEKIGKAHFQTAKEEKQNDRYQRLGLRSMGVIESILNQPQFDILKDILQKFKVGSIGPGHAE